MWEVGKGSFTLTGTRPWLDRPDPDLPAHPKRIQEEGTGSRVVVVASSMRSTLSMLLFYSICFLLARVNGVLLRDG
jgi:hypothetical protein